ncbi:hypothetical protein L2E82_10624 [Cichorium intybus]|uniref:Uncharacterized protein n=1 Tax=Cichorium intybus TaxID=13427 RepID=A0ACB9GAK6_CICIN|nr:hypothetical protein L2E82_10624 [Cichorium intybus]
MPLGLSAIASQLEQINTSLQTLLGFTTAPLALPPPPPLGNCPTPPPPTDDAKKEESNKDDAAQDSGSKDQSDQGATASEKARAWYLGEQLPPGNEHVSLEDDGLAFP